MPLKHSINANQIVQNELNLNFLLIVSFFFINNYHTTQNGIIMTSPEPIVARDGDTLNTSIIYSFVNGTPINYIDYFSIDRTSGLVKQLKRVDRSLVKSFTINIKAEQLDNPKRHSFAKLTIQIVAVDKNPPMIKASSYDGYVPEGSSIGTIVYQDKSTKVPLKLTVTDPDIVSII